MTAPKSNVGQKVANSVRSADRAVNGTCCMSVLVVLTAFLFSALLYINFLAANPSKSYGIFQNGISNVSRQYPLNITPAGWTFSIWGVIYLFQLSWILYSLGLLCRSTPSGPALHNPPVLTATFFIFFNVSSIMSMSWLVVFDRLYFMAAFIFIFCLMLSLYLTAATAARRIVQFRETLIDAGRKVELTFLNIAVLNGLSMYATWVTVATTINLGVVLKYKWFEPLPNESVSVICLAVLALVVVVYVSLDFSVMEKYTRASLSPYFTLIWALSGIVARHWDWENLKTSSLVAGVMLGSISFVTLVKLIYSVYKSRGEAYEYRLMKNRPM